VKDVGARVKKIFVPEMNMGQIGGEVMKYTTGEVIPYNQMNGQVIYPNAIIEQLRRLL
jgi:pyruvate/2-oxoacid:ferredoxin oxidoreductase alpha subunit